MKTSAVTRCSGTEGRRQIEPRKHQNQRSLPVRLIRRVQYTEYLVYRTSDHLGHDPKTWVDSLAGFAGSRPHASPRSGLQLETFRYHPLRGIPQSPRAGAYRAARPMDDTRSPRPALRVAWLQVNPRLSGIRRGRFMAARLSDPAQRNSSDRTWYLNEIRQVKSLLAGKPSPLPLRMNVHLDTT